MDEKLQDLMDLVRSSAVCAGEFVGYGARRAGDMVDAARLNLEILDLNGKVNDKLREIGQSVYDTHRGLFTDSEQLLQKLRELDTLQEDVALRRRQLARLKGKRACGACGKTAPQGDQFCRHCGAPLR